MSPANNWTVENLAWAAGLFEGEGCITQSPRQRLHLVSTDKDVVEKFLAIVGVGSISKNARVPSAGQLGKKLQWVWCCNSFQDVQALLAAFWKWLGERRKKRAIEILSKYRNAPVAPIDRKLSIVCPKGHRYTQETTYLHPKGTKVCKICRDAYMKQYHINRKARNGIVVI